MIKLWKKTEKQRMQEDPELHEKFCRHINTNIYMKS